jgi:hypothetical protein
MCDRRHGHTRGLELASMADVKRQQQDQVSATFNMFNSIVAIAVIVSLLGVVNTLAMSVPSALGTLAAILPARRAARLKGHRGARLRVVRRSPHQRRVIARMAVRPRCATIERER